MLIYMYLYTGNIIFLSFIADDVVSLPSSEQGSIEEVEIQIRPHPHLTNPNDTAIKNLLTSQLCTVSHLIRYISMNPGIYFTSTVKTLYFSYPFFRYRITRA